jgi:uncharacterized protein (TIGR03382 family)
MMLGTMTLQRNPGMKRLLISLFVAAAVLLAGRATASTAPCTPGPNWTKSWTDGYGQTTYTISAPPCVFLNVPFDVQLTVTDPTWTDTTVGQMWSVTDNGTVVPGASGTFINTVAGTWSQTISYKYTVLVVNHQIRFNFTDLGDGPSAHWYAAATPIGDLTLDPLPPGDPAPVDPPVSDPAPTTTDPASDPAPTDPAVGCATSGGGAGLLAFAAMALALRRRRAR